MAEVTTKIADIAGPTSYVITDSLANVMTGSGTSVSRRIHAQWQARGMDRYSIANAFKGSWLMRKIVKIPAKDATREPRRWQADKDAIGLLEREEKRLKVRQKMREGLILGLLGGGIVIMGVQQGKPSDPIDPTRLRKGSLRYLLPVHRYDITLGDIITDPDDDNFGEPGSFKLRPKEGQEIEIHRSRCLVFKGDFEGGLDVASTGKADKFWGVSKVEQVDDAVKNAMIAQDEIADLIYEAKIDVIAIPDLLSRMGDTARENQILRRLELAQVGKSNHRALIRDKDEEFEQRQITWAGMKDVIMVYLACAAGAADIPATRLMGKSPDGQNSTGDSDMENYHQMVKSLQEDSLQPAYEQLDEVLIPSALGNRPDDIYFEFPELSVPDDKDLAEQENKEADTVSKIVNTGLVPDGVMAQVVVNRMIESGRWPGLDAAIDELPEKWWETELEGDEDDLDDPEGVPGRPPAAPPPEPGSTATE